MDNKQTTNQKQTGVFTAQQLRDNPSFIQVDRLIRQNYGSVLVGATLLAATITIKEDQKLIELQIVYDMGNQTYLVFDPIVSFEGVVQIR